MASFTVQPVYAVQVVVPILQVPLLLVSRRIALGIQIVELHNDDTRLREYNPRPAGSTHV